MQPGPKPVHASAARLAAVCIVAHYTAVEQIHSSAKRDHHYAQHASMSANYIGSHLWSYQIKYLLGYSWKYQHVFCGQLALNSCLGTKYGGRRVNACQVLLFSGILVYGTWNEKKNRTLFDKKYAYCQSVDIDFPKRYLELRGWLSLNTGG